MKYKFLLLLLAVLLVLPVSVQAADATFSWIPNTESDLAGYKIHYGDITRSYTNEVDVGLPPVNSDGRVEYTLENIPEGVTFYAATAYDTARSESDYSVEVTDNAAPDAVRDFKIKVVVTVTVE